MPKTLATAGEASQWQRATTGQASKNRSLNAHGGGGFAMMESRHQYLRALIVSATIDSDSALRGRGRAGGPWIKRRSISAAQQAQAFESGIGHDRCCDLAFANFTQTGFNISTNGSEAQIGSDVGQLRLTA
jgi:hypothetical protein